MIIIQSKIFRAILLILLTACFSLAPRAVQAQCGNRILGFYVYYNGSYRSNKIPYSQLTHIAHAFLNINSDGSVTVPAGYLEPALITNAHANGVKVLASIGGADVTTFSGVAANSGYTATFADQIYNVIQTNGYDGVDIDWEFPQSNADKSNAVTFFQAIRNKFDSSPAPAPSWQISFDVQPGYWSNWVNYSALLPYVSFFNSMSYGGAGSWVGQTSHNCPLYIGTDPQTSDETVEGDLDNLIVNHSVPPSMINLGMPFYGVEFPNASGPFVACGCSSISNPNYTQLASWAGTSWTYNWDSGSQTPYLTGGASGTGFITYDNQQSVTLKENYAFGTRGIGGAFMWELSLDNMGDGTQPLLAAMYSASQANPAPTCTFTVTPTATATPTWTATSTLTSTITETPTGTLSPSATPTVTGTPTLAPVMGPAYLYPNPVRTDDPVNLVLPLTITSDVRVQIFTVAFRKLQDFTLPQMIPGGSCGCAVIPIQPFDNWGSHLANGLYYVVETTLDGTFTQKLLVLK